VRVPKPAERKPHRVAIDVAEKAPTVEAGEAPERRAA
jgi:hypothetical protein